MDQTVNHAQPQENGIGVQTNVFAKPQPPTGTELNVSALKIPSDLNAYHAHPQEHGTTVQINAFAHHQQMSGMELNVFAQLQLMDQTVSHAQPQDSGMVMPVFALKREYGTDNNAFVKPDYSVQTALNAHLNSSGMKKLKLVFVHHHSFITVNTVFVLNHISLIMVNVANVLMDSNGKKIDVHNADAALSPLSIGKIPTNNQLSILEQTLILLK